MAKKNEFSIYFTQDDNEVKFAVLEDVSQALQLVIALHQSSNVPHDIQVQDAYGTIVVSLLNLIDHAD